MRTCSVLWPSSIQGLATPWTYVLHLSLSCVILIDSSTESPVHVLMLSIQAVRGLPRLRAPGIVPCVISFSRQLPCFLMVWPQYASFLALTVSNSSLFTPALLRTHSFVFFADHAGQGPWNHTVSIHVCPSMGPQQQTPCYRCVCVMQILLVLSS